MKSLICSALVAVLGLSVGVQAYEVHKDVAYGKGERNVMDIFLPHGVKNPPLVLYIHGGAWFRGDKSQVEDYDRLKLMNEAGLAVATMNYTWSQQGIWPAQKNDVEAAIRFLQKKQRKYGYDMSKFGVWGQSSGAHLAMWSAVMDARDPSLGIDAVVTWYAPSNMFMLWHDRNADHVPGVSKAGDRPEPESALLGFTAHENEKEAAVASADIAAKNLPKNAELPSTLMVHGTADVRVSPLQSERAYKVFKARGANVELIRVKDGGHGGEQFNAVVEPSIQHLITYMNAK